jgi:hypothetical protein
LIGLNSRIIFISPVFSTYQRKAIEFKNLPIELWEIKQYYNNIISLNQLISSSNPTSSVPSSSTFPNLFDQSDAYRIKEPEIYDNYNGDIAESYTNSLRHLMGH